MGIMEDTAVREWRSLMGMGSQWAANYITIYLAT